MSLVDREDSENVGVVEEINEQVLENQNNDLPIEEKKSSSIFSKLKYVFYAFLFLFIAVPIISSLYSNSQELLVDNPTASGVVFQIDDMKSIELAAYSDTKIKLSGGTYSLSVDGKKVGTFEKSKLGGSSFLNPTNSVYISEHILFGDEKYYDKLPNNKIEAYGNETEGPFEKHEGIYIKGGWDYGLDEKIPEEVSLSRGRNYTIKEKIFRFDEFVDMYNEYYAIDEDETTDK